LQRAWASRCNLLKQQIEFALGEITETGLGIQRFEIGTPAGPLVARHGLSP
jgi:hypothetical protein